MNLSRVCSVLVLLSFTGLCVAQTTDFEVAEGFTVGGTWPSGWSSSSGGSGAAGVSTTYPVSGAQCLVFGTGGTSGGYGYIDYYPYYAIPADTKTVIQFYILPSPYNPPDNFNFADYGFVRIFDSIGYWAGGVRFHLEDYDGSDPASPGDFKINFAAYDHQQYVGVFIPGTYYKYTLTIDRAAGTTTHKLEKLDGTVVAELTYNVSVSSVDHLNFNYCHTPDGTFSYVDKLQFFQISPADFVAPQGVDLLDFTAFAAAWQSAPGDSNWNPDCDLVANSLIDIDDLAAFCADWLD